MSEADAKGLIVFTWGTFDCLHDGHKEFLKRLRQLGKLNVIVIPSEKKIENNGYRPLKDEFQRRDDLLNFGKIENQDLIEQVYIDCFDYGLASILAKRPNIFCLGFDQSEIWEKKIIEFMQEHKINATFIRILNENGNGVHSSRSQGQKNHAISS
ncbi:adenylyltransferase/cytidyltransferase family protein [bacterium]|nr:adenylyltransferase/cytidyltransferase family protein [bacterium]